MPRLRDTRAGLVQIDLTAEELERLDELVRAHGLRSRAAYVRHLIRLQPPTPKRKP